MEKNLPYIFWNNKILNMNVTFSGNEMTVELPSSAPSGIHCSLVFVCGEQCQFIAHGTPAFVAVGMDMPCVQFFQDTAAALVNV